MAKENGVRLECHIKFSARNPRHLRSARVLASVDNKYKTSFIALAIEQYMASHPMGISLDELLTMYRQTERGYMPKTPIAGNVQNSRIYRPSVDLPADTVETREDSETGSAIDKAMDFYDV